MIKLMIMDVDGVLTDGGIIYGSDELEIKKFHVRDGVGVTMAHRAGIITAVITVRESEAIARRVDELKITELYQGVRRKWDCVKQLMSKYDIHESEIAYIGDGLVDIPVMRRVGLPIAVANAVDEVKTIAKLTTALKGGEGAVWEAAVHILKQQGMWEQLLKEYLDELE